MIGKLKNKIKNVKKQNNKYKLYCLSLLIFFLFLILFRLHNSLSFNPYWGYDGGGHVDYIFSLAQKNKMPNIESNYLAWHEPLYYLLFSGLAKIFSFITRQTGFEIILKYLGICQAILSLLTSWVIYKLTKLLIKNKAIIVLTVIFVNLLPSFNQASTFLTNELLNYFFIFLILFYFIKNFLSAKKTVNINKYIILGILLGLAMITKITSFIVLIIIIGYLFLTSIQRKQFIAFKNILLMILIIFAINLPWLVYRKQNILDSFSINNTKFVTPQQLKLDQRLNFFTSFDSDIFKMPYFYSGRNSFWSMLYADAFFDYYGTMENRSYIHYLMAQDSKQLFKTSIHSTEAYVSKKNYNINKILVWLSIMPAVIFIIGFLYKLIIFIKKLKFDLNFFSFFIPMSFISALIYQAYRYPYYEKGIVKAIFIFPAFIFFTVSGLEAACKISKKLLYPIALFVLIYCILIIKIYWIMPFDY